MTKYLEDYLFLKQKNRRYAAAFFCKLKATHWVITIIR